MKSKKGLLFKIIALSMACLSVFNAVLLVQKPKPLNWFFLILTLIVFILFILEYFYIFSNIRKYIIKLNSNIIKTEKESLYSFPAPALIINSEKYIVWFNKAFEERVFTDKDPYGIKLDELLDIDIKKVYNVNGTVIKHDDRFYRVKASTSVVNDTDLSMVYFEDISQFKALESEHFNSRPCVIMLMIDNYDEVLQNVKESEKAQTLVKIETLLENFMENTTGMLKRISSDKFIIVLEERHLSKMIANRFDILDKAREITISERFFVTLSMGVGRGGKTLFENEGLAKQALDMSLGRGGDQCALKTSSGFEFFGGISKGIEKHTKVKTRIIATALEELALSCEKVLIMGHKYGDLDSVGSATGLCGAFKKINKEAYVVVNPNKNLSESLIEYIKEKDDNEMYIDPSQALEIMDDKTLLIIVDTHNPDYLDSQDLYKEAKDVVVIDHHRKMVNFIDNAVIFYHEPYASSTCEMVSELIQYIGNKNPISSYQAEALLSGIMLDTKNFIMRTGVRTFEAAAYLRRLGADTVSVKGLFSNSFKTYQEKSKLVASSEIFRGCAISMSDSLSDEIRLAAPQAADELLGISGVTASFVIFNMNGLINISARSLGTLNVQLIMEKLGGGGHQTMAAAQLSNVDMHDARQKLIYAIDQYMG